MDSNIKQQRETNTRHIEINHVRACPSAQVKADDEKKRGRYKAQFSDAQLINQTTLHWSFKRGLYSAINSPAKALNIKSYV